MPKRIPLQRRGRAKPKFRPRTHKSLGKIELPKQENTGIILDLLHDNIKSAPIMKVRFGKDVMLLAATNGSRVGENIMIHKLADLPEGSLVCNVESRPGAGPKLIRSAGGAGRIVGKEGKLTSVLLPSKEIKKIHSECRAIVGRVAGAGMTEKPMLKAGAGFYAMKAKGIIWPRVRATKKNAVDHPFGGGGKTLGKKKTVSRHASPGRKVGSISARRTGKRRGKK
ncbi:50S ribosomal protein L2 [archaeon CG10_big_fil_rev_8_21_14_0_10_43_11]|nr:MAG: 50S ribosomal protein L2 [archaeon CG10_big_fil_rev_8_21_14_0_10_43_11]